MNTYSLSPDEVPDSAALQKILDEIPDGSKILLKGGHCRFQKEQTQKLTLSLSNSDPADFLFVSLLVKNRKNLILDGGGSELLCHGQLLPAAFLNCENITLENFSIDWDIPLTAEGTVIQSRDDYVDVFVDSQKYPFYVEDGTLWFKVGGSAQKLHCWGHTEFDIHKNRLAYNRGDRFPPTRQQLLPGGQIRFLGDFKGRRPTPGNILVLRHGERLHPGLLIHHCKNISVRNCRLFSSGGLGILAQFSRDLAFEELYLGPNRAKGRRFASLHDDGIHLSANAGHISIRNCHFLGLMDDPVNLHGIAAKIISQKDCCTFKGKFLHPQSKGHTLWAEPGDTIAFLSGDTMEELAVSKVKCFRLLNEDTFEISFQNPVSLNHPNLSLENLSKTASLTCENNYFGPCRARGLLVTTPQKVLIQNNIFESAGAAIRIAGDVCTWYESGRCRDVVIQNNTFLESCLTNNYQGGQAVISISPELPAPDASLPCHKNIRIIRNIFHTCGCRLLYALCTRHILFAENQIYRSTIYPQKSFGAPCFFEHCQDTAEENNTWQ